TPDPESRDRRDHRLRRHGAQLDGRRSRCGRGVRRPRLGGSSRNSRRDRRRISGRASSSRGGTGGRVSIGLLASVHERVPRRAAAERQIRTLNTNTRYLHEHLARYAERLTSTLPQPLRICYFVNSGSEANELALRLARAHTRQRDLVVLDAAYHGNTTTLIDISPYKFNGPGGAGRPSWVHVVPVPDVYRGAHKKDDPQAGAKYAAAVARLLD